MLFGHASINTCDGLEATQFALSLIPRYSHLALSRSPLSPTSSYHLKNCLCYLFPFSPNGSETKFPLLSFGLALFFSLLLCLCLSLSRTTRVFLTNLTTPCPHPQVDHAPSSPAFPFAPPFHIINLLLRPREPLASLESAIGPGQLAKHIVASSSWSCVLVFRCRRCRLLSSTRLLSAFDIQNHLGFASSQRR